MSVAIATKDRAPAIAWPTGCGHPNTCARHRGCMYLGCAHSDRPIGDEIDAAIDALPTRWRAEDIGIRRGQVVVKRNHSAGGSENRITLSAGLWPSRWKLVDTDEAGPASDDMAAIL